MAEDPFYNLRFVEDSDRLGPIGDLFSVVPIWIARKVDLSGKSMEDLKLEICTPFFAWTEEEAKRGVRDMDIVGPFHNARNAYRELGRWYAENEALYDRRFRQLFAERAA